MNGMRRFSHDHKFSLAIGKSNTWPSSIMTDGRAALISKDRPVVNFQAPCLQKEDATEDSTMEKECDFSSNSIPAVQLPEISDEPPAFPSLNSAQRQANDTRSKHTFFSLSDSSNSVSSSLAPPPSAASKLRSPQLRESGRLDKPVARKKVALAPGCSPLDWARLKSIKDLRVCVYS